MQQVAARPSSAAQRRCACQLWQQTAQQTCRRLMQPYTPLDRKGKPPVIPGNRLDPVPHVVSMAMQHCP